MTSHPMYCVVVLLLIEGVVLTLAQRPIGKKLFKYLPSMFWIYFLPMLVTTAGLLPPANPVYVWIGKWILPAALVLLLLSADVRGILRLGPMALRVMAAATCGVMAGAIVAAMVFRSWLPEEGWKAIGALSASWIGGSANMIAVGKAVEIPESLMGVITIVDTLFSYTWMGMLIAVSVLQERFDRQNRSNTGLIKELTLRAGNGGVSGKGGLSAGSLVWMAMIAIAGAGVAVQAGGKLPPIENVLSPAAYAVILATGIGVFLSFTPARKLESRGSNTVGFALLYLVLASIGAKTHLGLVKSVPVFLAVGATMLVIHGICLLFAARLFRAPMALLATASQANIGGPASAPVVAGIYHPELAPVGLLLAVCGNILGTFLGIAVSHVCRWVG
ncbi:MAG: DUF819 family protein [Anaerohalosphaeraceae bacterium]